MNTGYTDRPIINLDEDLFGVKKYIDGLTDYISVCNTPMTIAVQGDWGTGKTSIMNMIRENIKDKCLCAWFNTWEYSQFNMSDELTISLLKSIVASLNIEEDTTLNKSLKILANGLKSGTLMAIDMTAGGRVADTAEKVFDGLSKQPQCDYFASIKALKEQFQDHIDRALAQSGKDRVIMFIDDLDRLNPEKAVEILEVLKNFLDCENCVFILAIDYKVVSQGVKLKYNNVLDDDKGKAFFEKIIQLPFKVPVVEYNLYNYVKYSLNEIGYSNEINIDLCVQLISHSIGKNPRAIKRLLNSALLLKKIQGNQLSSKESELILFGILCLQLSFEEVYTFFVSNIQDFGSIEDLSKMTGTDYFLAKDEGKSLAEELNLTSDDVFKIVKLMKSIVNTIDEDNPRSPSEDKFQNFIELVGISTLTSTFTSGDQTTSLENEFRWKNRELCKAMCSKMSDEMPQLEFKVYQPRKNREYWKRTNACIYTYISLGGFDLDVELQAFSDVETKHSHLNIRLAFYTNDRDDLDQIKHILSANPDVFGDFTPGSEDISYVKIIEDITNADNNKIIELGCGEFRLLLEAISKIEEKQNVSK